MYEYFESRERQKKLHATTFNEECNDFFLASFVGSPNFYLLIYSFIEKKSSRTRK